MNYYSQYLFQSPLYEDTYIDNDIIIEYLNENFYPQEINEMYTDFLIDTFGYQILDENYYDFIVNQYGEDILVEGFGNFVKSLFGIGPDTNPSKQQERNHYVPNNKPHIVSTPPAPKWKHTLSDLTDKIADPHARERVMSAAARNNDIRKSLENYKKQSDIEEIERILGRDISQAQIDQYHNNRRAKAEENFINSILYRNKRKK